MDKQEITRWIETHFRESPGNILTEEAAIRPDLAGLRLFEPPLVGFAAADDPLFERYKQEGVIGPWYMGPDEWLPGARSVISLFFPFTEEVRQSNRKNREETSPQWLHGRIEGQAFLALFLQELCGWLTAQGARALAPVLDPRFRGGLVSEWDQGHPEADHHVVASNWSERHAAYVCALGTFGLSKGIITKKGMAGRLGGVLTDLELPPDSRPYTGIYDYCAFCGACVRRCPVSAISMETGKDHFICRDRMSELKVRYAPRYGCGQCQTGVPCEHGIPVSL